MAETSTPHHDRLDWAALLAKWMEFARAAVALPTEGEGGRWRRSITPIITLQAVTLALGEATSLPESERAVALDRAEILIKRESQALARLWGDEAPEEIALLLSDARAALAQAQKSEKRNAG